MERIKEGNRPAAILLSHAHLDHIMSLPFLSGIYSGKTVIYGSSGIASQITTLFNAGFHPVTFDKLAGVEIREIDTGTSFYIGNFMVETMATNHPGGGLAYKISTDNPYSFKELIMKYPLSLIRQESVLHMN